MKKAIYSLLFFLGVGGAAFAQTEQGNWLAGGNLELNTAQKSTRIDISPTIGYFFLNNLAAGANVLLDYSKVGDTKSTTLGVGPFARYYMGLSMVRPFLHANIDFTSNKTTVASVSNTFTGTNYLLAAGIAAFLNRNVALEGLAGYSHTAYEHQKGSGGFDLRVGFQVYLSRAQMAKVTK